jgi:hypothetical protein
MNNFKKQMIKNLSRAGVLLGLSLIVLSFQNCAQKDFGASNGSKSSTSNVAAGGSEAPPTGSGDPVIPGSGVPPAGGSGGWPPIPSVPGGGGGTPGGGVPGGGTGIPGDGSADGDIDTGQPIDGVVDGFFRDIEKVDPEFDRRSVYYARISIVQELISGIIQKVHDSSAKTCKAQWAMKIVVAVWNGSRNLSLPKCAGFQRGLDIKAKNGACSAKITDQRTFSLAPIIKIERTTELDANCLCFRRYRGELVGGKLVDHEVRVFLASDKCAAAFAEYR